MIETQGEGTLAEFGSQNVPPSPIQRIRHTRRIVGFVAAVGIVGAAAFAVGMFVRLPEETALKNVDASIDVWVRAQERVVEAGFSLPVALGAASEVKVVVTEASPYGATPAVSAPTGALDETASSDQKTAGESGKSASTTDQARASMPSTDRVVVSAAGAVSGESLAYGQFLAEVSGRPIFAWPSTAPLYRDLTVGLTGSDVRGVQETLKQLGHLDAEPDGIFGRKTLQALAGLYKSSEYSLPMIDGQQGLSWREFIAIPGLPATVITAAEVGSVLSDDSPLLSARSQTPMLTAIALARDAPQLQPGADVGISVDGGPPVRTTISAIGEFIADEKSNVSGYPLTIAYPAELGVHAPGASAVLRRWSEQTPTLAVPATAIRQDSEGAYVLVKNAMGPKKGALKRVFVQVTAQDDGWVSLGKDTGLTSGTEVLVSGGNGR